MRKAVLSPTDLTASKRMMLTLFAASLVGMVALFGVGLRPYLKMEALEAANNSNPQRSRR